MNNHAAFYTISADNMNGLVYPVSGDDTARSNARVMAFRPSAGNLWAQPGVSDFERVF